jgi:hypothetical protein
MSFIFLFSIWKRREEELYYKDIFYLTHLPLGAIDEVLPWDRYRVHDIQGRPHHRQGPCGAYDLSEDEAD